MASQKDQLNTQNNEDEDPVDAMISKTGCLKLHHAVQMCIAEKKDWRLCQDEVNEFRKCIEKAKKTVK